MAAIFQIRRGTSDASPTLQDGELYLHRGKNSLQVAIGDGNPITLLALNTSSVGDINLTGSISASNMFVSGNLTVSGNLFLGNNQSDNISALGVFTTNLVPGTNNLYDVGTPTAIWKTMYANTFSGSFEGSILGLGNPTQFSASVDSRIINNSSSLNNLSASVSSLSSSFDIRITNNSSSITTLSSSVSSLSSSFDNRITNNSSSINALSSSVYIDSSSFDIRIANNSSSISVLSSSVYIDSGSFNTRITNNSSSINALSSSVYIDSSSFDIRIANNSSSISSLNTYTASLKTAIDVTGGNTRILGNLIVDGTQTSLNTTNTYIEDKLLTLSSGSESSLLSDGSGFEIAGANVSMSWEHTNTRFAINTNVGIIGSISASTVVGLNGDSVTVYSTSVDSRLSNLQSKSASVDNSITNLNNVSSSLISKTGSYATTGSNSFIGDQSINGNLYLTGSLIPSGNFVYDLGSSTNGFGDVYLSSSTVYMNNNAIFGTTDVVPVNVGDYLQGGIVYYVDTVNGFSYIVNKDDIGEVSYSNFTRVAGANSSVLGGGITNTNAITASTGGQQNPAKLCSDFAGGGYTDWYLPSTRELALIATNTNLMGASLAASRYYRYWSSTADSNASNTYYAGDDTRDDNLFTNLGYGNTIMYSMNSAGYGFSQYTGKVKAVRRTSITSIIRTLSFPNFNFSGSINVEGTIDGIAIGAFTTQSNERLTDLESSSANLNLVTASLNLYTASANNKLIALETISASHIASISQINLVTASLNLYTASANNKLIALETISASHIASINQINSVTASLNSWTGSGFFNGYSTSVDSRILSLSGSVYYLTLIGLGGLDLNAKFINIEAFTSSADTRLNNIELTTSSLNLTVSNINQFTTSANSRLNNLEAATSSYETTGRGIVSGSSQIIPLLPTGTVSGSSQVIGILTSLNTFTASNDNTSLNSYTSSLKGAITISGTDVSIAGGLTVLGTTTIIDSTTLNIKDNIIQLNGAGAANAGIVVKDATGTTTSGSLLWDTANDYWIAGPLGAESKLLRQNGDNVVSGSSQITYANISSIPGGIISSSAQIDTLFNIDGLVSGSSQITYSNISSIPAGIVSGSTQTIAHLPNGTVSGSSQITYADISSIPAGIVSGSSQVTLSSTTGGGTSANVQFGSLGIGTTASGTGGEIRATGDITAFYSSDIRLKENIQPIQNALEKVESISGNTYDWKDGYDEIHSHKGNDVGVIAQEIEEILPQIVTNRDNGYKAVQYEKIVPLLIEAIKELSAKIKVLENK